MTQFLAMGGYAWYVWMSYGAVALVVVVETLMVRARRRRALTAAQSLGTPPTAPRARFDRAQSV